MADTKFIPGLRTYRPNEKAPDFVKLDIVMNVAEFTDWIQKERKSQVRMQLLLSQQGNLYIAENDFEPQKQDKPNDGYSDWD